MTPEQRQAVATEARRWIGTPWHHQARVIGAGVDCVMLVCEVFEAAGLIPHVVPDYYPIDVMMHKVDEPVTPYFARYAVPVGVPEIGDVVLYKFGHSFSHAAIVVGDGLVVHALRHAGQVLETGIDEGPLAGRTRVYFTMGAL